MGAMKVEVPGRKLIPASVESGTTTARRVRLAQALAAMAKAKTSGTTNPPKRAGGKGKKQIKPGFRRCKLAADDQARGAALERRLEILRRRTRGGDLVGAGLSAAGAAVETTGARDACFQALAGLASYGDPAAQSELIRLRLAYLNRTCAGGRSVDRAAQRPSS